MIPWPPDISPDQIVALRALSDDLSASLDSWDQDRTSIQTQAHQATQWFAKNSTKLKTNKQQWAARERIDDLVQAIRTLGKDAERLQRLANKIYDICRTELRTAPQWDPRSMKAMRDNLETARDAVVEAYRAVTYPHQQALWLQSRFPDAAITAVPGLCKVVSRAEIEAADGSFTPGRYVGVGAVDEEDEESVLDRLSEIYGELETLRLESDDLSSAVLGTLKGILE